MDETGQVYGTFKLLIAAIVTMAILAILIPIIMQLAGFADESGDGVARNVNPAQSCRNLWATTKDNALYVFPPFEGFIEMVEEDLNADIYPQIHQAEFDQAACLDETCQEFASVSCDIPAKLFTRGEKKVSYKITLHYSFLIKEWQEWIKDKEMLSR